MFVVTSPATPNSYCTQPSHGREPLKQKTHVHRASSSKALLALQNQVILTANVAWEPFHGVFPLSASGYDGRSYSTFGSAKMNGACLLGDPSRNELPLHVSIHGSLKLGLHLPTSLPILIRTSCEGRSLLLGPRHFFFGENEQVLLLRIQTTHIERTTPGSTAGCPEVALSC